ncbi:hypothetical protein AYO47_08225 [Planctomyces sp. SCGC AG-212-M04]|nr:hypothetical protein AYO47_08225 [Planctomyces sp. SCGC AG-212-M04]
MPLVAFDSADVGAQTATPASAEALVPEKLTLEGSVVDRRGAPVDGAEIRVVHFRGPVATGESETLTTTDARGQFRIVLGRSELNEGGRELLDPYSTLVASKAGYGAAWGRAFCFEKAGEIRKRLTETDRTLFQLGRHADRDVLTLVPDTVLLRGRLLSEDGTAVAGARIAVYSIMFGRDGTLDEWERASADPKATFDSTGTGLGDELYSGGRDGFSSVPQVTSDAEGRFVVRGIGDERIAQFVVHADGHESAIVRARTRAGETRRTTQDLIHPEQNVLTYRPCEFEHRLRRVRPLEGQVTDERTGHPIAGVSVTFHTVGGPHSNGLQHFLAATTDPTGMFRVSGLPQEGGGMVIRPPADSGYIMGSAYAVGADGRFPVARVRLTPGLVLRGRIVDRESRQPIRGLVDYFALKRNPLSGGASFEVSSQRIEVPTDSDGRYQIAVLPGEGILAFRADDYAAYEPGGGVEDVRKTFGLAGDISSTTVPSYVSVGWFHALMPINVTAETTGFEFRLIRAVSIQGTVQGFARNPRSVLRIYGLEPESYWHETEQDDFVVQGYSPKTGRRVTVVSEPDNQVAVVDLLGPPPQKVALRLERGGRIRGRLVDPKGKPQPNLLLYEGDDFAAFPQPSSNKKEQRDRGVILDTWLNQSLVTDDEGRFEVWGVVPGLKYTLGVEGEAPEVGEVYLGEIFRDIVVAPGQTRDLGDIVVERTAEKQEVRTVVGP